MQDNNIIQEAIDTLKRLRKENAELKAENERLKEENFDYNIACTRLEEYGKCLKQTLQEIKKIAEKECKDCLNKRNDSCWICPYYPILELITKAESEG